MPHARPGKEWLHLRDAICVGNTDAVVDVLAGESIHIDYEDMEIMLMGLKQGGTDACAVVDEREFKFAINDMIAQATAVDPLTTFTKERWDRVFNDMVGRASGRLPVGPGAHEPGHQQTWQEALMDARRWAVTKNQYALVYIDALLGGEVGERAEEYSQAGIYGSDRQSAIQAQMLYVLNNLASWRGEEARAAKAVLRAVSKGDIPAHYTDETPEGALEAMERRLQEVLATMDLRVGELAEAIQQMGATGIPVPVVEAIEDAVEAITIAAEEATEATEAVGFTLPRQGTKARMIADHLLQLGADAGTTDMATFLEGIRAANPGTSFNDMDYYGIIRRFPLLPRLSLLGRGHRRGVGGPQEPAAPPVDITERRTPTGRIPRGRKPWREESSRTAALTSYMIEQGANLSTMDPDEIAAAVQERWPGTTGRQVQSAYNNATNRGTKLPKLKRRPYGPSPGTPQPLGHPRAPSTPAPPPVGRPGTPTTTEEIESLEERTAAVYMDVLGDDLTGKTAEEIRADLIYQWPDITLAQIRNGWNSLRWIRHAQGQPRPPMLRASDAPGTIEGLLGGAGDLRPERQIRNGGSWSRKYYPGLPEWQHDANDAWFESALNLLKPDGIIGIPNLQRAFNKQGEEIPWPGESEIRPPNRVMMNPPTSMRASWY